MPIGDAFAEVQDFYQLVMQATASNDPNAFFALMTEERSIRIFTAVNVLAEEIEARLADLEESPVKHILASIWWHNKTTAVLRSVVDLIAKVGPTAEPAIEAAPEPIHALDDVFARTIQRKP